MAGVRIIPRLDIKGPNVVKGIHTEGLRVVGDPRELAKGYYEDGADEILYMDIVASLYRRSLDLELLRSVANEIFVPLTVGGGIRSLNDISNALRAGADKVAINTYAVERPEFLREAVLDFGSQCVVLSVEAKRIGDNRWEVYTDGGREHSGRDVIEWVKDGLVQGVGEIVLTSVDRDGARQGYDLELIRGISHISPVPVIAHGGAGVPESVHEAITAGADAVAASSIFHYRECAIPELKRFLAARGVSVRL